MNGQLIIVQELKSFLKNFQEKYKSFEKFKIISDKQRYSNLFSGINTIKSIFDNISEYFADNYNVFSILRNIETKEEITHTPFLANLLDINETHSQKSLFYKNFITQLFDDNKDIEYFTSIDYDYFFVEQTSSVSLNQGAF